MKSRASKYVIIVVVYAFAWLFGASAVHKLLEIESLLGTLQGAFASVSSTWIAAGAAVVLSVELSLAFFLVAADYRDLKRPLIYLIVVQGFLLVASAFLYWGGEQPASCNCTGIALLDQGDIAWFPAARNAALLAVAVTVFILFKRRQPEY